MKFKTDVVEQFLSNFYNIDSRKYLLKRMQESNTSARRQISKHVLLQQRFKTRKNIDPGFRYHIIDQVTKDKHALKMTLLYVQKILTDIAYFDECSTFSPDSKIECENEKNHPVQSTKYDSEYKSAIKAIYNYKSGSIKIVPEEMQKAVEIANEKSDNFFDQMYVYALEKGDDFKAVAIQQVKSETKTCEIKLLDIDKQQEYYWDGKDNSIIFGWVEYGYKNHAFEDLSQSKKLSDSLYAGNIIPVITTSIRPTEFNDTFLSRFGKLDDLVRDQGNRKLDCFEEIKLLYDAFSIASLIWFSSLELKNKEELLNGNYSLDAERFTENLKETDYGESNYFSKLAINAKKCSQSGFFDIASIILEYIHNNSENHNDKVTSLYELGDILRLKMDYGGALEYYKRAYEHADKNEINESAKIAHLKMAEMEYLLGKTDIANEYIIEVQKGIQNSTIDERLNVIWTMSLVFGGSGQYEREYKCLNEFVELSKDEMCDHVELANNRLDFLNSFLIGYGLNLDIDEIKKCDLMEKKNDLVSIVNNLIESFQFKYAVDYLNDILKIDNDPKIRLKKIFVYYDMKQLDSAKSELSQLTDETEDLEILALCHLYLALIHFHNNKDDIGFSELEESIKLGISCGEIDELINNCIIRLLSLRKGELLKKSLEKVVNVVSDSCFNNVVIPFIWDITVHLSHYGFLSDAVYFANIALEKSNDDTELRVLSLVNMANLYSTTGDYEKSLKHIEKATSIDSNSSDIWKEMADICSKTLNYKRAEECVEKALAIKPDNSTYNKLKQNYNELSKDQINFSKITDYDVKMYLSSAERIVIKLNNTSDDRFDFSLSLVSYGKGLETMLHNRISRPLITKIHKEYGTPIASSHFKQLPKSLKNLFGVKEKTMQLGSWRYIFEDCKSKNNDGIIKKSRDYFADKLNKDKDMIFDACNVVSEYRNGASHYTSKSKDEILVARKEIIEHINNVISVLYD